MNFQSTKSYIVLKLSKNTPKNILEIYKLLKNYSIY